MNKWMNLNECLLINLLLTAPGCCLQSKWIWTVLCLTRPAWVWLYCPCSSCVHSPAHCKTFLVWTQPIGVPRDGWCLTVTILDQLQPRASSPSNRSLVGGGSDEGGSIGCLLQDHHSCSYIPRLKLLAKQTVNPGRPRGCGLGSSSRVGDHLIPLPNLLCLVWSHKRKKRG